MPYSPRHRFDIGSNEEFKVKLTPAHNDPVLQEESTHTGAYQGGTRTITIPWELRTLP